MWCRTPQNTIPNMKPFELHTVCNELLEELRQTISPAQQIVLSIDILLNTTFRGSYTTLVNSIRSRALAAAGIKNINFILIELVFHSNEKNHILAHCKITAEKEIARRSGSPATPIKKRNTKVNVKHLYALRLARPELKSEKLLTKVVLP